MAFHVSMMLVLCKVGCSFSSNNLIVSMFFINDFPMTIS